MSKGDSRMTDGNKRLQSDPGPAGPLVMSGNAPLARPQNGAVAAAHVRPPAVHIEPSRGWASLHLGELWRYRELLYFFVWRDVKVHYKQTALGASWAVIQPFMT